MTNAARDLARLLELWTVPPGESVLDRRASLAGEGGVEGYVADAVALIRSLDHTLVGLDCVGEDVEAFRECLPSWYGAVFEFHTKWNDAVGSETVAIHPAELRNLRMLASYLDHVGLGELPDRDLSSLLEALDTVDELIDSEPNVRAQARAYMHALVYQIRQLLENRQDFGDDLIRRATMELAGALHTTADSGVIGPDDVPKWRKTAKAIAVSILLPPVLALADAGGDYVRDAIGPAGTGSQVTVIVNQVDSDQNSDPPATQEAHR